MRCIFSFSVSILMLSLCVAPSCAGAAVPSLKAVKYCGTITEAQLRDQWIQRDKSKIAQDRAKLLVIAGKSGVEAQRKLLLTDIVRLRIDLRKAKSIRSTPPMPPWFNPGVLPVGRTGMIPGYPKVFQVIDKTDALCRISRSYMVAVVYGAPFYTSHALVLLSGLDFSLVSNRSHVNITQPCRVVGVYKYQTAIGSSNTVPEIEPLHYLKSPQTKKPKK